MERCSKCGRLREVSRRKRAKYPGVLFFDLRCRGTSQEHDPPSRYWEVNGQIQPVPKEVLFKLSGRSPRTFSTPICTKLNCPGFGSRMEAAGHRGRQQKVLAFRCRGTQHYEFSLAASGATAERKGYAHYEAVDPQTGEHVIVRSRMGKKEALTKTPHQNCPKHHVGLLKYSGPGGARRRSHTIE
jgi:hypothetical protein